LPTLVSEARLAVRIHSNLKLLDICCCVAVFAGIYFGDTERGHTLSFAFTLRDAQARGFRRSFSVVVFSYDRAFLLTSWQLMATRVAAFVHFASSRSEKVARAEDEVHDERAARLKRRGLAPDVHVRSIVDITGAVPASSLGFPSKREKKT
jgi:hypothetical protein